MDDLYNRIHALCESHDITIGKMCNKLSISRGNLTELKMGRIKTLKAENLTKISGYFGVSIDYLLHGTAQNSEKHLENGIHIWKNESPVGVDISVLDALPPDSYKTLYQSKSLLIAADKNATATDADIAEIIRTYTSQDSAEKNVTQALSDREQRDIARRVEKIMSDMAAGGELMFDGTPMSDEDIRNLRIAMDAGLRLVREKNKETYTPKKYKKEQ
ncbi:helix-turn-helix domain-containing protein [uncultured Dysosmobacter sp.]|uniref:helix-turn-helix domain-containing protein n=1 Tax=uncultured Dysosmobacter sp. TaxID=2591384 RepID=UPI00260B6D6B|nr:helix-turn-helix domain-containing protein [uncultured Dysosmobacter sp.]